MNIIELLSSIQQRPHFFLKQKNLLELDAFLNGFNTAEFARDPKSIDVFRQFQEWLNDENSHLYSDWVQHFIKDSDPYELFFTKWNLFCEKQSNDGRQI